MLPKLKKKKKSAPAGEQTSKLDVPVVHTNGSSVETIDAAMYQWVDENKNAFCTTNKGWKKVPVIWSTPERAKQVKGYRELRDASGQLILPIITVERTGVVKDMARRGPYWANIPPKDKSKNVLTIARKISQEKTRNFQNADMKRTRGQINFKTAKRNDKVVYEYISIPQPVYVDVSYKITVWAEYQQQMNEIIQPFMTTGGGINYDTIQNSGYKYEIFIGDAFSQEDNVSSMEEDERKYQTSIEIKALGLLIGDGPNDETPMATVTQNAVEVKIPREEVIMHWTPDQAVDTSSSGRDGISTDRPSLGSASAKPAGGVAVRTSSKKTTQASTSDVDDCNFTLASLECASDCTT